MWDPILNAFRRYPSQEKVVRLLILRGFSVSEKGRITSGGIEIPHTQVASEVGVDRRVVDSTCEKIREDPLLREVFANLRSTAALSEMAPLLGMGVIVVRPNDASDVGILSAVTSAVAESGIIIRQAFTDDPQFSDDPTMTVITDGKVPGELVDKLVALPLVKSVTVH